MADPPDEARRARSIRDDTLLDREPDQFGAGFQIQVFHETVFVIFDRPRGYLQEGPDFPGRAALGDQLEHLPLTRCQTVDDLLVLVRHRFSQPGSLTPMSSGGRIPAGHRV